MIFFQDLILSSQGFNYGFMKVGHNGANCITQQLFYNDSTLAGRKCFQYWSILLGIIMLIISLFKGSTFDNERVKAYPVSAT